MVIIKMISRPSSTSAKYLPSKALYEESLGTPEK
jgi:hypothetical protein